MDKKSLLRLSCGMYVIGSGFNGKRNALIANTVFQLASKPALVGVCISKEVLTHELILNSGFFSVSVLEDGAPMEFVKSLGFKSGASIDKTLGLATTDINGVVVFLDHACACLTARVLDVADCMSHSLFIGEVLYAQTLSDKEPLTYAAYRKNKGATPKTSPTFHAEPLQPTGKS